MEDITGQKSTGMYPGSQRLYRFFRWSEANTLGAVVPPPPRHNAKPSFGPKNLEDTVIDKWADFKLERAVLY